MINNNYFYLNPFLLLSACLFSATPVLSVGPVSKEEMSPPTQRKAPKSKYISPLVELAKKAAIQELHRKDDMSGYNNSLSVVKAHSQETRTVCPNTYLEVVNEGLFVIFKNIFPKKFSAGSLQLIESEDVKSLFFNPQAHSADFAKLYEKAMKTYFAKWDMEQLQDLWNNLEKHAEARTLVTQSFMDVAFETSSPNDLKSWPFVSTVQMEVEGKSVQVFATILRDCPHIKSIGLTVRVPAVMGQVTTQDLEALSLIPSLQYLSIAWAQIRDIYFLTEAPSLRKLDLEGNPFRFVSAFTDASYLHDLEFLNLGSTNIRNISVFGLASNLNTLDLSWTEIDDISALSTLVKLRILNLQGTEVMNVSGLADLPNLESLDLGATPVKDISAFGKALKLQILRLTSTAVEDVSSLAKVSSLHILFLGSTKVADVSKLAEAPNLETLDLSDTPVTDVSKLAEAPRLCVLKLSNTKVVDISHFTKTLNLRELDLRSTPVEDVSALAQAKELHTLNLKGTQVMDVSKLAEAPKLKILNCADSKVTDISALDGHISCEI